MADSTGSIGWAYRLNDQRLPARTALSRSGRAGAMLSGVGLLALATTMPWAEFSATGLAVMGRPVPLPLIAVFLLAFFLGMGWSLACWSAVLRRVSPGMRWLAAAVLVGGALSVAGAEYGYRRPGALDAYLYREPARCIASTLAIALLATAWPGYGWLGVIWTKSLGWHHRRHGLLPWLLAAGVIAVAGAVCLLVLDGMPHVIDGVTYLLQGRTYASGRITLDPPAHPELFQSELLAFKLSGRGYFGKYPPFWPLILGLFDLAGVAWLAGPVMAGAAVIVTHRLVRVLTGRDGIANWTMLLTAACPWLWLNAATMLSHTAATLLLMLILLGFAHAIRTGSRVSAMASGVALGLCILTRPGDALFFCLPCVGLSIAMIMREPKRWLSRLPLCALGTLPGLLVYIWLNRYLAGDMGGSMYGMSHREAIMYNAPTSPQHAVIWFQESWAGLSRHWAVGVIPVGAMAIAGLLIGRREIKGAWLLLACTASLLLCYTWFVFGGMAWVGPRWYTPAIPGVALCVSASLLAAWHAVRCAHPATPLFRGYLRFAAMAGAVMLLVALPVKLVELRQTPPHGIDGRLTRSIEASGIHNAVVALPVKGLVPGTVVPHYKRGIAGMWSMQTPFESSDVIYVRQVEGWEQMAADAWPTRSLYQVNATPGDYQLTPVASPTTDGERP